jgi:hypothetical protein
MLAALSATGFANVGAKIAELLHELRTAAHKSCGRKADVGTVSVKADAFGHLGYIALIQASVRTMLALLSTPQTRIDASLALLMGHDGLLEVRALANVAKPEVSKSGARFRRDLNRGKEN